MLLRIWNFPGYYLNTEMYFSPATIPIKFDGIFPKILTFETDRKMKPKLFANDRLICVNCNVIIIILITANVQTLPLFLVIWYVCWGINESLLLNSFPAQGHQWNLSNTDLLQLQTNQRYYRKCNIFN